MQMKSENLLADQTLIACDVCGEINPGGNGGVLLLDKDNTYTLECQDCWDNFTSLPRDQRKIKNEAVVMASMYQIGTDPISYEILDPNKSFIYNAYKNRIKNGKKPTHFRDVLDGNLDVKFYPTVEKGVPRASYCAQCLNLMKKKASLKCGQCKLCTYCSKECQKLDWSRHKVTCNEFARVKKDLAE